MAVFVVRKMVPRKEHRHKRTHILPIQSNRKCVAARLHQFHHRRIPIYDWIFFSHIKNSHSTLGVTLTPFENRISTERDHLAATDHLLWRWPNFWSAHTVAKLENQLKCSRIINEVTHSLKPFRAMIERTISPKGPKYPAYYVQLISFDSAPILQADCSRALFLSFSFQGIDHIHFTHRWSSSTASGRRFFFYPTEGTASYRTKLSSASS